MRATAPSPATGDARVVAGRAVCYTANVSPPPDERPPEPHAEPPAAPHPSLVPFAAAAERRLTVHGKEVRLVHVPGRAYRPLRSGPARPAFAPSPAERIIREEAYWRGDGLALTPNRHPFAPEQRILWTTEPAREPDLRFWQAAVAWVERTRGMGLLNTIGAAATIVRAHAHLVPTPWPFLPSLRDEPADDLVHGLDLPPACTLHQKAVPFVVLGVRGPTAARAEALLRLASLRLTAAWNVALFAGEAWLLPRRTETPAPDFPHALGAAEFAGQWCYTDADAFAAATPEVLERALAAAGVTR
jgi:hypothetical protein